MSSAGISIYLSIKSYQEAMAESKITQDLRGVLTKMAGKEVVDIILEFDQIIDSFQENQTRQMKIKSLKDHLLTNVDEIKDFIEQNGGQIINQIWLNGSIEVKIPAGKVDKLSEFEVVKKLDNPQKLDFSER
jgi:2,4-dienoyl-CoA reductase-like NADH-dependent reductase (Old Yellow Enzyme family)